MFGDEFGVLMASSDEEIVEFGSTDGKKWGLTTIFGRPLRKFHSLTVAKPHVKLQDT